MRLYDKKPAMISLQQHSNNFWEWSGLEVMQCTNNIRIWEGKIILKIVHLFLKKLQSPKLHFYHVCFHSLYIKISNVIMFISSYSFQVLSPLLSIHDDDTTTKSEDAGVEQQGILVSFKKVKNKTKTIYSYWFKV